MYTRYTQIEAKIRFNHTVESILRRIVGCEGEQVHRFVVANESNMLFTVRITSSNRPVTLKTEAVFHLSGLPETTPSTTNSTVET